MQSIRQAVQSDFDAVNGLIIANLESDVAMVENVGHYIIDAGGKRLRPMMVLHTARCCGYEGNSHIKLAAAVEFIHTATLLHDDVVDLSTLRRGRPTANAEFGNAPSVLVGDFLYSRAFQLMVELGNMDIMANMAKTTNTIAEGEVLQLVRAGDASASEEQYIDVITRKTAILFAAACYGGGVIAGADAKNLRSLHDYGLNTGIAFQIFDDVLDYTGDPDEMGKNVGDDLNEGKLTLPLIHLRNTGDKAQRDLVETSIANKDSTRIGDIVEAVKHNGSLDYASTVAAEYRDRALKCLESMPQNAHLMALQDIAELSLNRSH